MGNGKVTNALQFSAQQSEISTSPAGRNGAKEMIHALNFNILKKGPRSTVVNFFLSS